MAAAQGTLRDLGTLYQGFWPEQVRVGMSPEALEANSPVQRVNPHAHPLGYSVSEKVQIAFTVRRVDAAGHKKRVLAAGL